MSELVADPVIGSDTLPPATAGGRLRAARLARGLTLDDVAEILRFSAHQIDALERDDYARLPGATLVRGMMRSYAKLLKISAEPLLAELDNHVPSNLTDVRPPTYIDEAATQTQVARVSRGALYAIALAVALFALLALFVNLATDTSPASTEAKAVLAPAPATPVVAAPAPAVAQADPAAGSSDVNVQASATIPPSGSVSPPSDAVVLEFDELSWVEVTDATQSIVLRGEYPKGTRQVLEGKLPFALWIGRASAVRVTSGERSIDLRPYTRENVARLTVE